MIYADMSSLETYLGGAAADWHAANADAERVLEHCERRMLQRIIPNSPRTERQKQAFCAAVYAQLLHELKNPPAQIPDERIQSVRLNGFSATLKNTPADAAFPGGLCPEARAALQLSGLSAREVRAG